MTDFKAKMHQIRFRLGLCPRPRWGSLQRSPKPPSWIWGPLRGKGRGWAGEKEGKGKGREVGGSGGEGKEGPPSYCWTRAPHSLATPLVSKMHRSRETGIHGSSVRLKLSEEAPCTVTRYDKLCVKRIFCVVSLHLLWTSLASLIRRFSR